MLCTTSVATGCPGLACPGPPACLHPPAGGGGGGGTPLWGTKATLIDVPEDGGQQACLERFLEQVDDPSLRGTRRRAVPGRRGPLGLAPAANASTLGLLSKQLRELRLQLREVLAARGQLVPLLEQLQLVVRLLRQGGIRVCDVGRRRLGTRPRPDDGGLLLHECRDVLDDAILLVVARGHLLLLRRRGHALRLSEDGQEHGEEDEDGDEEVREEHDGIQVIFGIREDGVDVEVAEERARERDDGARLRVERLHHRPELHVEELGEGEHRDHEDEGEEDELDARLSEHRRRERHFGDERVCELDDLEQLDAEAIREEHLRVHVRRHHLPVVAVAEVLAEGRALAVLLELQSVLNQRPEDEEQDEVGPVHEVPDVEEVGLPVLDELDPLEDHEEHAERERDVGEEDEVPLARRALDACVHVVRRQHGPVPRRLEHELDARAEALLGVAKRQDDLHEPRLHVDEVPTLQVVPPTLDGSSHEARRATERVVHWKVGIAQLVEVLAVVGEAHAEEGALCPVECTRGRQRRRIPASIPGGRARRRGGTKLFRLPRASGVDGVGTEVEQVVGGAALLGKVGVREEGQRGRGEPAALVLGQRRHERGEVVWRRSECRGRVVPPRRERWIPGGGPVESKVGDLALVAGLDVASAGEGREQALVRRERLRARLPYEEALRPIELVHPLHHLLDRPAGGTLEVEAAAAVGPDVVVAAFASINSRQVHRPFRAPRVQQALGADVGGARPEVAEQARDQHLITPLPDVGDAADGSERVVRGVEHVLDERVCDHLVEEELGRRTHRVGEDLEDEDVHDVHDELHAIRVEEIADGPG
mmetsp:Transcript_52816/g.136769  ORF Transcript_52816/g.136769 Transcript_52816/m.136769 type:complete len:823 (-) Transcript_52816:265-2733(-)